MPEHTITIPHPDDILGQHNGLIASIRSCCAETGLDNTIITDLVASDLSPVRNLARWIGGLPASESNHDADQNGLFRHSLQVSLNLMQLLLSRCKGQSSQELQKAVIAGLVLGLTHDIAKAWFVSVWKADAPKNTWNIMKGPLVRVSERGFFDPGAVVTVKHKYGRSTKFLGHESLGVYFLSQIVPLATLARVVGLRQANNIPAVLTAHLGGTMMGMEQLLHEADMAAASKGRTVVPASAVRPVPALGSGTRVDDFIAEFRLHGKERKLGVNGSADQNRRMMILVSPTHTILPYQYGAKTTNVFAAIYNAVRHRIVSSNAPPDVRAFYNGSGSDKDYIHGLLTLGRSHADGERWLVRVPIANGEPDVEVTASVHHHSGRITVQGLMIPNGVLWGDVDPIALYDPCPWAISIRSHDHGVVIPAAEFGFIPSPDDTIIPEVKPSPGVTGYGDLALQLWKVAVQLVPTLEPSPLATKQALLHDRIMRRDKVLGDEVVQVLEGVIDRFRDAAARGGIKAQVAEALTTILPVAEKTMDAVAPMPKRASTMPPTTPVAPPEPPEDTTDEPDLPPEPMAQPDDSHPEEQDDGLGEEPLREPQVMDNDDDMTASVKRATAAAGIRQGDRQSQIISVVRLTPLLPLLPLDRTGDIRTALVLRQGTTHLVRWPEAFTEFARLLMPDLDVSDDDIETSLFRILSLPTIHPVMGIVPGSNGQNIQRLMVGGGIGRFLMVNPTATKAQGLMETCTMKAVPITTWSPA